MADIVHNKLASRHSPKSIYLKHYKHGPYTLAWSFWGKVHSNLFENWKKYSRVLHAFRFKRHQPPHFQSALINKLSSSFLRFYSTWDIYFCKVLREKVTKKIQFVNKVCAYFSRPAFSACQARTEVKHPCLSKVSVFIDCNKTDLLSDQITTNHTPCRFWKADVRYI